MKDNFYCSHTDQRCYNVTMKSTGNLVVIFVEVFIFPPADKIYRYIHRHRKVSTVNQSQRRALSVGLD